VDSFGECVRNPSVSGVHEQGGAGDELRGVLASAAVLQEKLQLGSLRTCRISGAVRRRDYL